MKNQKLKIKYQIRIYYFILCALTLHFALCTLHLGKVNAEGISLSVAPSLIQVQITPPANAKAPVSIQNQSDESVNLEIKLIPFRQSSENGEIEHLQPDSYPESFKKMTKYITVTDNGIGTSGFELGPKQKKKLEVQFAIPKNEAEADYYFSIVFITRQHINPNLSNEAGKNSIEANPLIEQDQLNNTEQKQNISYLNAGVAMNILLSINEPVETSTFQTAQAEIMDFSIKIKDNLPLIQSGPVEFITRIKNTSRHVIAPKGMILIKNIFGQTIGRIDLKPSNILSSGTRSLTALTANYPVTKGDTSSSSNIASNSGNNQFPLPNSPGSENIIWPEKFLLGPYTATLNVALSDEGPVYNKSIIFLALPLQFLFILIILIIIIIFVIIRVRYHLKTDK